MTQTNARVILKSMREKSVRNRHPRLFAGAIKDVEGKPKDGDIVEVLDNKGAWLARGLINQQSQTAVRLLTWDEREQVDDAFWHARVKAAIARRETDPLLANTNARRLIYGESDGLPGLVADDYGGHIAAQFSALAALRYKDALLDALEQNAGAKSIHAVADVERLQYERVTPARELGSRGEPPAGPVEVHENGLRYLVDVIGGQKTGFYLDQRENRARLAKYCRGARVLNAFSYTGAFAIAALSNGAASVVNVDSSAEALVLAERNLILNDDKLNGEAELIEADAFEDVRARRKEGQQFDVVILDPPKFAHAPDQVDRAARAYKDLNRIGMALVKPGGILATFSCSGVVDPKLFQQIIFSAALEANREASIIEKLSQASDHPILLTFPESEYLKGLVLRMA
ncbi:MAG TPA: class I SAM-dependent rRNA methyltransferase [Thermoflexales bacterium]|nr:class I SAM-dependent rRNA methyltransferase [Thermoflexales bacterium]HQW36478.1 class I SAM-dependent rRNA methyltransferase [Thermoflexales bacterium]HQZ20982.1 class I SAM-dependent rRNA methyltransferase [Thermoflexales bacterium]